MARGVIARLAWAVAGLLLFASIYSTAVLIGQAESLLEKVSSVAWSILPAVFAAGGALIISNRPRNIIGWLLLGPAAGFTVAGLVSLSIAVDAPATVTAGTLLALWYENWSWLLLIFPLFHLLQVFPTGTVLSSRWKWLVWVEVAMVGFLIATGAFVEEIGPTDGDWTVANPIGFIPRAFFEGGAFFPVWTAGLLALTIGGVASTIVRFRRASSMERQQIKWLLFAFSQFTVVFAVAAVAQGFTAGGILDGLLFLSILAIPLAIVAAVVRYRLFDIDVIIRRSLIYASLTGVLGGVYFGSVMLFRTLIGGALGESSFGVVASTLVVAALFTPARRRIQILIDRRLYRSRYNAEQVIEAFTRSLQTSTDVDGISSGLFGVVVGTVQPRSAGLWIRHVREPTAHATQEVGPNQAPVDRP